MTDQIALSRQLGEEGSRILLELLDAWGAVTDGDVAPVLVAIDDLDPDDRTAALFAAVAGLSDPAIAVAASLYAAATQAAGAP